MVDVFEAPHVTEPSEDGAGFPAFEFDTASTSGTASFMESAWAKVFKYWGFAAPMPKSLEEIEIERENARKETARSALHTLDLRGRARVKLTMERVSSVVPREKWPEIAARANWARRSFMNDVRLTLEQQRDDMFEAIAELERRYFEATDAEILRFDTPETGTKLDG
jgi:hypothetical protein